MSPRALLPAAAALVALTVGAAAQKGRGGAILPGGNASKPISIEAVKLDYFDKEQKLVYSGDVVATQGDAKLKARVLTIFLSPKTGAPGAASPSTTQVQRMLATGPVTLVQRDQIGTGENGVYDKGTNTVVLSGGVTLSRGGDVTKGDKLTYDLKSGQAIVSGRVKSMFLPSSGTGNAEDARARKSGGKSHRM